jgi:hypothetical protein
MPREIDERSKRVLTFNFTSPKLNPQDIFSFGLSRIDKMTTSYFYLRPGAFSVIGFAYGKVEPAETRGSKMKVKLVQSGRWAEEQAESVDMAEAELTPRSVTPEDTLDGVGTYVGGVICTFWVQPGAARVWDYGLVVGYKWCPEPRHGIFDMQFGGTEASIVHAAHSIQDVVVEIYDLRPCGGQSTSLLMASEMKQLHAKVYNKFNGVGGTTLALLADVGGKLCDETWRLPLLDITSFEMSQVTVYHILDYVFYKECGRSHPAGMTFGDTIFDEAESSACTVVATASRPVAAPSGTEVVLSDGLSDSDDDDQSQGNKIQAQKDLQNQSTGR